MFINLTARKANGDFYITSSEVIKDTFPVELSDLAVRELLEERARVLAREGWTVTLDEDIEDPRQYAEDSADVDAVYYGA